MHQADELYSRSIGPGIKVGSCLVLRNGALSEADNGSDFKGCQFGLNAMLLYTAYS